MICDAMLLKRRNAVCNLQNLATNVISISPEKQLEMNAAGLARLICSYK